MRRTSQSQSCLRCVLCRKCTSASSTSCDCAVCAPLQVPIRIIYMSAQAGDAPVDMQPEYLTPQQQAALGGPTVHMLYRPGHYDILLPK